MNAEAERARVLVVDDAAANIRMLAAALRDEHQILVATNGSDGLRIAATPPHPDLILLDVVMPDLDGYAVCRTLKEADATRHIPVIFITARSEEEDETHGLELGAVDYITKPFSLAIVRARVRTHLELKRHRDRLEALSSLDGLTGVPNRRRFDELLDREWRRAMRDLRELSVVMCDLDHFKGYNDTYGHAAGDACLRSVAGALDAELRRAADWLARYGGEEFAVVLPGHGREAAAARAEGLREAVAGLVIEHRASSVADHVTLSLGVATRIPSRTSTPEALLKLADEALYRAKSAGRNRVVAAPPRGV